MIFKGVLRLNCMTLIFQLALLSLLSFGPCRFVIFVSCAIRENSSYVFDEETNLRMFSNEETTLRMFSNEETNLGMFSDEENTLRMFSNEETTLRMFSDEENTLRMLTDKETTFSIYSDEETTLRYPSLDSTSIILRDSFDDFRDFVLVKETDDEDKEEDEEEKENSNTPSESEYNASSYRFVFPNETHHLEPHNLESQIPPICSPYIESLKDVFLSQVTAVLASWNQSKDCQESEAVTQNQELWSPESSGSDDEKKDSETVDEDSHYNTQQFFLITSPQTLTLNTSCSSTLTFETRNIKYELNLLFSSPTLLLQAKSFSPNLKDFEEAKMMKGGNVFQKLTLSSSSEFFTLICRCLSKVKFCESKVEFLSRPRESEDILMINNFDSKTLFLHSHSHKILFFQNFDYNVTLKTNASCLLLSSYLTEPTLESFDDSILLKETQFYSRRLTSNTYLLLYCHSSEETLCWILINTTSSTLSTTNNSGSSGSTTTTTTSVSHHFSNSSLSSESLTKSPSSSSFSSCDPRCHYHGICTEGVCECSIGWNGAHCTLLGCPDNCGHGDCVQDSLSSWTCKCFSGYEGRNCALELESNCEDKIDNDEDGLIDCQDPECCLSSELCSLTSLCISSLPPVLSSSKGSSSSSSKSFIDSIAFLLDDVQRYAKKESFDPLTVSVIRGRILSKTGAGLPGVRISREDALHEGFTLSQSDGTFDYVTHGGGVVILIFGRSPYPIQNKHFALLPNDITHVGDVILQLQKQQVQFKKKPSFCLAHRYANHSLVELRTSETFSYVEKLELEKSSLSMTYVSYSSITSILFQIIDGYPSESLLRTHFHISIQGLRFTYILEPEKDLNFTFDWNRLNAYGEKVYGVAKLRASVGFEYSNCSFIVKEKKTFSVVGFPHSHFSEWNLNIHHAYDPRHHILYKGTGDVISLTEETLYVEIVDFYRGRAVNDTLIRPFGIAINSKGLLYIADMNLIKEVNETSGKLRILLTLNETSSETKYYLAIDPLTDSLYVSLPLDKLIIRVKEPLSNDTRGNYERIAGNGEKCKSFSYCGDGGPSEKATLIYPKGITFDENGVMYIADGRTLREIRNGIIRTIVGDGGSMNKEWRPWRCDPGWQVEALTALLLWPTTIVYSGNGVLRFLDDGDIFELRDNVLRSLYIHPSFCNSLDKRSTVHQYLTEDVSNIAFDTFGNFFMVINSLSDEGSKFERTKILSVNSFGEITSVLPSFSEHSEPSTELLWISDIVINYQGDIIVCDSEKKRIRKIVRGVKAYTFDEVFEIPDPESNELYVFSKTGTHLETRALLTDSPVIRFDYDEFNNLIVVTNTHKEKLELHRDYSQSNRPLLGISLNDQFRHVVSMNGNKKIDSLFYPSGRTKSIEYEKNRIWSVLENSDRRTVIEYDDRGVFLRGVSPDGTIFSIQNTGEKCQKNVFYTYKEYKLPGRLSDFRFLRLPYNYNHVFKWEHYVRVSSRSFDTLNGIGKHFIMRKKKIFSVEMHPRSGIQSIYRGKERLLRREEFAIPHRRLWIPETSTGLTFMDESFTKRQISSFIFGDHREDFVYDDQMRLSLFSVNNKSMLYSYDKSNSVYPSNITILSNGGVYRLKHDSHGDLVSITTPLNYSHDFQIRILLGKSILSYRPPWSSLPFEFPLNLNRSSSTSSRTDENQRGLSNPEGLSYNITLDPSTGLLLSYYDYIYESENRKSRIVNPKISLLYEFESDEMNRDSRKSLRINGSLLFSEHIHYKNQIVTRVKEVGKEQKNINSETNTYTFEEGGRLRKANEWTFDYDLNGNVIISNFSSGSIRHEIEFGERISSLNSREYTVVYNEFGHLTSRHNYSFDYNDKNQLISILNSNELHCTFFYDETLSRVRNMYKKDVLIDFYYDVSNKPFLITRVVSENISLTLVYDFRDRLIGFWQNEEHYIVQSDLMGTPEVIYSQKGELHSQFFRTPFGALYHQTGAQNVFFPIGYQGNVEDTESGSVIIKGRAYDAHLGQWRTPEYTSTFLFSKNSQSIFKLHGYQKNSHLVPFFKNSFSGNTFDDWLTLLRLPRPKSIMSSVSDDSLTAFSNIEVEQGFSFVSPSQKAPSLFRSFLTTASLFGSNLLVFLSSNIVRSRAFEKASQVEQILSFLLHESYFLSLISSSSTLEFMRKESNLTSEYFTLIESTYPSYFTPTIISKTKTILRFKTAQQLIDLVFWIGFDSEKEIQFHRS